MNKILVTSIFLGILTFSCHLDKLTDSGNDCLNPPSASFSIEGGGTDCKAPCTVTFINSSTNAVSYKLKFGDGDSTSFTTGEISHTYQNAGNFSISLIASGDAGCPSSSITKQLTVLPEGDAPIAGFNIDLSSNDGFVPCNVKFTNTSSNSTSFEWDFGDGSPKSNVINPLHTYSSSGDFIVKLSAFGTGPTDIEAKTVLIKARTFKKTFGGVGQDDGKSVQQTTDNGYILGGSSDGYMHIVKVDELGSLKWEKTFSVPSYCNKGDGYLFAGTNTSNLNNLDAMVVKTDDQGNTIWEKSIDNLNFDRANSIIQIDNSININILVLGQTEPIINGFNNDMLLVALDYNGNEVWRKTYGGTGDDIGYSLCNSADGNYILLGSSEGPGGRDIYVIKIDGFGEIIWEKTFGDAGSNDATCISPTSDGGYIVSGFICNSTFSFCLLKINFDGELVWYKSIGTNNGFNTANSIQETLDGGFIVFGSSTDNATGNHDFYLIKANSAGELLWEKKFGGAGGDTGNSVQQTFDGGFIMLGSTDSFGAGGRDFWLIKTDKDGNVQ